MVTLSSAGLNRLGDNTRHIGAQGAVLSYARVCHFELAQTARPFDDVAASRETALHEFLEHRRQGVVRLKKLRENHGILDRETGAVGAMRRGRMRRIPDQDDAAAVPG